MRKTARASTGKRRKVSRQSDVKDQEIDLTESNVKHLPLRIMLFDRGNFVPDDDRMIRKQQTIQSDLQAHWFREGHDPDSKKTFNAGQAFQELPVEIRLLRSCERPAFAGLTQRTRADKWDFVPLDGIQNGLELVCRFIADWVTRHVVNPLQRQRAWPIPSDDNKDADPGPFHALMFGLETVRPAYTMEQKEYQGRSSDKLVDYFYEGSQHARWLTVRRHDFRPAEWIQMGHPTYALLKEIRRALAGTRQDITTWFAYDALVLLRRLFTEDIKWHDDGAPQRDDQGPTWMFIRQRLAAACLPPDCLLFVFNLDGTAFAPAINENRHPQATEVSGLWWTSAPTLFKMITQNLGSWYSSFGNDADTPPRSALVESRQALDVFLDGKVEEKTFDKDCDELLRVLFGTLEPDRPSTRSHAETLKLLMSGYQRHLGFFKQHIRETLRKHLFGPSQDKIPQRDETAHNGVITWTLTREGQTQAWANLSPMAQYMLQENPGCIIHALLMGEDPERLSADAVIPANYPRRAARYKYMQKRAVYYDDHGDTVDQLEHQGFRGKAAGLDPVQKLFTLHPEPKLRNILYIPKARKETRPGVYEPSRAARDAMSITAVQKLLLDFSAKARLQ